MDIPKFDDLVEKKMLTGDKVRIDDLLNKQIVVCGFQVSTSKYKDKGCGYRSFGKYVLLRKSTAKRTQRRFMDFERSPEKYGEDFIIRSKASTNGVLKHCCSYNLRKSLNMI